VAHLDPEDTVRPGIALGPADYSHTVDHEDTGQAAWDSRREGHSKQPENPRVRVEG